jgi:N-acetylmuramoyl-L-alanine amidase
MSVWIEKFINVNEFARSGKKLTEVRKLVVHYTANPGASAENHYRYFNTLKDRYASAHIFVDKIQAINIIPLGEIAYHAGDIQRRNADGSAWRGVKELLPSANNLSIGVEMCIEKDGTFHPDTITRSEDVFMELCKKFNLDPLCDIVRHRDVTWKNCPAPWVKDEQQFVDFKNRIKSKLNPHKPVAPTPTNLYRVRKTWADIKSQIGAYGDLQNAIDLAKKNVGYEVYDSTGKQVYPTTTATAPIQTKPATVKAVKPAYPNVLIKEGSKGEFVKMVQRVVGVKDDGVFGSKTKAAVKTWQSKHGLTSDGIVGKNTWSVMF